MACETASTALEYPGVFFQWMKNINSDVDENWEFAGLRFRYDCSGVIADITLSPEDLNAEEKSGSAVAELLERYDKITTFWDDEPEPTREDVEAVENDIEQFIRNLCSPILQAIVPPSSENYDPKSLPDNLERYMYPKSVNLQITESNGALQVVRRDDLPPFREYRAVPAGPLQEAELLSYSPSQVRVVERYLPWALKVSVDENVMFCKINRVNHDSFEKEYRALQNILNADDSDFIKAPKLKGTVQVAEGVVGILVDLIDTDHRDLTFRLSDEGQISESLRSKWESQLTETLAQLHAIEVVWGDAKTANVLVDKNLDLWIIDFGGGQTQGWVADELVGTKEGDLQALERILQDIRGESSKEDVVQGRTFRMNGRGDEPLEDELEDNEDGCRGGCDCHQRSKKQRRD